MKASSTLVLRDQPAARKIFGAAARALLVLSLLLTATSAAIAAPRPATPGVAQHLIIENVGQFAPDARFLLKSAGQSLWLTDDAIWLTASTVGTTVRFTFAGSNPHPALEPYGRITADVSYLVGTDPTQWRADVPAWAGVRYRDLYPGIDLVVGDSATGTVPWRLEARAGADLGAVSVRVEGAEAVVDRGTVRLQAGERSLDVALPTSTPSTAATSQDASPEAGDLLFNTTTGGNALDAGYGVAVDFAGNSYVTGETQSNNFPTLGPYDGSYNGGRDAFVAKYDAGGVLKYATYLGGAADDTGWGIAVEGNLAYVVGETQSTNFPVIGGSVVNTDICVAALTANGSGLRYVSRVGGNNQDYGYWVAVENSEAYLVGHTYSTNLTGANCVLATVPDLIVAKLNSAGSTVYTTCLGGSDVEVGNGIAVRNGDAYVTGESMSADFPGGLSATNGDILVAHLNASGAVAGSTLVGGTGEDVGYGIALDSAGNVYVGGSAGSYDGTTNDFPVTTATAYAGGANDGVVMKLTPALGTPPLFATYLGGQGEDDLYRIAVDTVGAIYVGGSTLSDNFRTTAGAYDTAYGGGFDPFVTRLHLSSSVTDKVTYSTYLGGAQDDFDFGADTDTGGNAFVAGLIQATVNPATSNASLWKLKVSSPPDPPAASIAINGPDVTLSWQPITGATSYQVISSETPYRKPGNTSNFLSRAGQGPTSQTDGGVVSKATNYYYVIKAVNDKPEASLNSNQVGKFTFSLVKGG